MMTKVEADTSNINHSFIIQKQASMPKKCSHSPMRGQMKECSKQCCLVSLVYFIKFSQECNSLITLCTFVNSVKTYLMSTYYVLSSVLDAYSTSKPKTKILVLPVMGNREKH